MGHQALALYPQCVGVPLHRLAFRGTSSQRELAYESKDATDEVEDLHRLLAAVKARHPDVAAAAAGAIASDYQRLRLEHVCGRLGLVALAPLWHRPQRRLLQARKPDLC